MKKIFILLLLVGIISCGKNTNENNEVSKVENKIQIEEIYPKEGFYNNSDSDVILKTLSSATKSIDMEIYQFTDLDVVSLIYKAIDKKVQIRIVKEPSPVGDSCNVFQDIKENEDPSCLIQKNLRRKILDAGGSYIAFNKKELCGIQGKSCVMHGKMIIVDKKLALISTGNFNRSNLCNLNLNPTKCNRDYTYIVKEEKTVNTLLNVFENDLKEKKYELNKLISDSQTDLTVSPYSLGPLVNFIKSAKKSIRVNNQYLKEPTINNALIEAAKNGVNVEVILASVCSFGYVPKKDQQMYQNLFSPFVEAGINLKMLPAKFKIQGRPGYMHAKAIVVDDERAWVGSVNGSTSATSANREFGIFFNKLEDVEKLNNLIKSDLESSHLETSDESIKCVKDKNEDSSEDEAED